ncbi:hypothetical protein SeLEV6574_g08261 [Synchytrium endobioticum]|nr:hypothetical protein SeLEV6574_g08261 [Synchytrium endobioticum]
MSHLDDGTAALKSLVADVLSKRGILSKIKAELRSATYTIIQEQTTATPPPTRLTSITTSLSGRIAALLVHDFLNTAELKCTMSVYEPESHLDTAMLKSSSDILASELGLKPSSSPALVTLIDYLLDNRDAPKVATTISSSSVLHNVHAFGIPAAMPPKEPSVELPKAQAARPLKAKTLAELEQEEEEVAAAAVAQNHESEGDDETDSNLLNPCDDVDGLDKLQSLDANLRHKDAQHPQNSESEYLTTDHTISPSMSVGNMDHVEPVADL